MRKEQASLSIARKLPVRNLGARWVKEQTASPSAAFLTRNAPSSGENMRARRGKAHPMQIFVRWSTCSRRRRAKDWAVLTLRRNRKEADLGKRNNLEASATCCPAKLLSGGASIVDQRAKTCIFFRFARQRRAAVAALNGRDFTFSQFRFSSLE